MLEVYSEGVSVNEGSYVPFNSVSLSKGCSAVLGSASSIQLNKCGVYMVACSGSASISGATGNVGIQMFKNGVAQPQAQSSSTGEEGDTVSLGFTTLVQVKENNTCCCCSSPTILEFQNTGADAAFDVNVCVTKVC